MVICPVDILELKKDIWIGWWVLPLALGLAKMTKCPSSLRLLGKKLKNVARVEFGFRARVKILRRGTKNNPVNQKRRNEAACYTFDYQECTIRNIRKKNFDSNKKGKPLEYFAYPCLESRCGRSLIMISEWLLYRVIDSKWDSRMFVPNKGWDERSQGQELWQ